MRSSSLRRALPALLGMLLVLPACVPPPEALQPAAVGSTSTGGTTPTTTSGTATTAPTTPAGTGEPTTGSAPTGEPGTGRAEPVRAPVTAPDDPDEGTAPPPRTAPPAAPAGSVASDVGESTLHRITCDQSEAEVAASGAPRVTRGDATIYIGGQQVGGNDQAPRVVRFDGGEQTWCREDLERSGDDGRGYGLLWSGEVLLGVFSATGNQGDASGDLRRFTGSGWLRSYADRSPRGGGGPKVSVLVRLDPATGAGIPDSGTWITADRRGNVNSASVTALALTGDGGVRVTVESAFTPRKADRSGSSCSGSSPFTSTYTFDPGLRTVTAVTLDDRCN